MKRFLIFGAIMLLMLGCEREQNLPYVVPAHDNLVFKYGLECGWNAYMDTLIVRQDSIWMSVNRTSPSPNGLHIDTAMATPPQVWQAFKDSLNWQNFTALNISTYHVGADGCDYWLKIQNDTAFHEIRFGLSDKLPSIKPLLRQLDSTWSQIGPWPALP